MTLTLKYFASLREAIGRDTETLDLPPGVSTAQALRNWLCDRGEPWATALAPGRAVRMAINFDMVGPDAALPATGEIAFFPPVTGG